jgi:hypothetical protein
MSTLKEKIDAAYGVIDAVLQEYRRPCVMWSGGKDSQVLLWLLRRRGVTCPVVLHRHPKFPEKYEFHDRMAREWGLEVHDWAPIENTMLNEKPGQVCVMSEYQQGQERCAIPWDIYEPERWTGNWACGLQDFYHRPKGTQEFPWDVVFHGHKSTDVDPLFGAVPLKVDVKPGAPAYAFPLRQWSDADIWEASRACGIPQQEDRYNLETGKENPDRTSNPDYFAGCMRCLNRELAGTVQCPKLKLEIESQAGRVRYKELPVVDYIERKD